MAKKQEAEVLNVEGDNVTKVIHANPHGDPICDGCGKPINTVQVRQDGKQYHNQYCLNQAN